MQIKKTLLCLVSLALLSACAPKKENVKPDSAKTPVAINPSSADKNQRIFELLSFIETYSNLAPEAQKKMFAATSQSLADSKNTEAKNTEAKNNVELREKLAIMLAIPTSRLREPNKAQNMLQELLREESLSQPENDLLGLLYEYALNDNKQQQKIRDDLKKLEAAQQKVDALQQKHDALQQKLNDLKKIEKTLNDRTSTDNRP